MDEMVDQTEALMLAAAANRLARNSTCQVLVWDLHGVEVVSWNQVPDVPFMRLFPDKDRFSFIYKLKTSF
ncbi:MAG: hypothetical protein ACFFAU_17040 [Candidatus Hodarchaeota archaeon]